MQNLRLLFSQDLLEDEVYYGWLREYNFSYYWRREGEELTKLIARLEQHVKELK